MNTPTPTRCEHNRLPTACPHCGTLPTPASGTPETVEALYAAHERDKEYGWGKPAYSEMYIRALDLETRLRDALAELASLRQGPGNAHLQEALEAVDAPQDSEGNRIHYLPIEQARVLASHIRAQSGKVGEWATEKERLEGLVYVPGDFKCHACGFTLHKRVMDANTGAVGVNEFADADPCPNGCGTLRPVTWKEDAHMLGEAVELLQTLRPLPPEGATTGGSEAGLSLSALRAANEARHVEWWRPGENPSVTLEFRGNELAGEVGEACNVIKKLARERLGMRGSRATIQQLAEEIADVVICADLVAMDSGIDLGKAVADKFNATSEKVGLTTRILSGRVHTEGGEG